MTIHLSHVSHSLHNVIFKVKSLAILQTKLYFHPCLSGLLPEVSSFLISQPSSLSANIQRRESQHTISGYHAAVSALKSGISNMSNFSPNSSLECLLFNIDEENRINTRRTATSFSYRKRNNWFKILSYAWCSVS